MNGAEVNTKSRVARSIGNGRVHVRRGKENYSARFTYDPQLGIEFNRLLSPRLLASIGLNLLRSTATAFLVPSIIVVIPGAVLDGLVPIFRMNRQTVLRYNIVDGKPPVNLAKWRRVPGIPVRMEGVSQSRSEVVIARGRPKTGNIEIGLGQVTAKFLQESLDQLLGSGMMNELGLKEFEYRSVLFLRHFKLRFRRLVRRKGLFR